MILKRSAPLRTQLSPPNTRLIFVPPGGPRTKPNALNLGLSKARGQYIAVYDAEDQPHPAQLRAAHHAFSKGLDNMVCVQAPLVARMNRGGWIATHWALEYAVQFGLILPSMALYRLPNFDRRNQQSFSQIRSTGAGRVGFIQCHGRCRPWHANGAGRLGVWDHCTANL